ncbi:unnamed protein product [marine sediment metagenome]|uniref:Uncharacterized protein n=1 Tax=marine sediment metagenome TaxID=412755 RepID=X1C725_9ZZZZ
MVKNIPPKILTIIIKGCNFRRKGIFNLFEHLKDVHHLGDGWYICRICDFKSKSSQDLQKHLTFDN